MYLFFILLFWAIKIIILLLNQIDWKDAEGVGIHSFVGAELLAEAPW